MKFCTKHNEEARAALAVRGLDHLIAETRDEVTRRMSEVEAGAAIFCPLGSILFSMINEYISGYGAVALKPRRKGDKTMPENDGEFCPLCLRQFEFEGHLNGPDGYCHSPFCNVQVLPGEESWAKTFLNDTADQAFEYVMKNNLIKRAS